jgi:predicted DNA-binding protein
MENELEKVHVLPDYIGLERDADGAVVDMTEVSPIAQLSLRYLDRIEGRAEAVSDAALTVRCSPELMAKLDTFADRVGVTKSRLIRDLLESGLDEVAYNLANAKTYVKEPS